MAGTKANRWCFSWFAKGPGSGKSRAALQKNAKWTKGETITVSFLDGDKELQKKVKKAALQWTAPGLANLKLQFRADTNETDIRISFKYKGSWSSIGKTCRQVPVPQPTMNFGWLKPGSSQAEIDEVVLHEFGHALGLIHEHQHPKGGIKWDKPRVIESLSGPPNNWTEKQIDFNVFKPAAAKETNSTKQMDEDSIMMYPFPKEWTTDGVTMKSNSTLSANDKAFIHKQYP